MNTFQWITVPVLCLLVLLEIRRLGGHRWQLHLARLTIFAAAAVMIASPQLASRLAHSVGIGRGTDLVIYAFMLIATGTMLHFYGRQFTLRRDLVELARREALRDPMAGQGLPINWSREPSSPTDELARGAR